MTLDAKIYNEYNGKDGSFQWLSIMYVQVFAEGIIDVRIAPFHPIPFTFVAAYQGITLSRKRLYKSILWIESNTQIHITLVSISAILHNVFWC